MYNNFKDRYDKLNSEQRQAVDTIDGPLLVIAGPGSGKTELLSLRIANILSQDMISPGQILCLTFTDSGAHNMRERLLQIIGNTAHEVAIHTFHSFAKRIMDEYSEYFYNAHNFEAASDIDKSSILDDIFQKLPHDNPLASFHPRLGWSYYHDVRERISLIKRAGYNSELYNELINNDKDNLLLVQNIINKHWPKTRLSIKELDWLAVLIQELAAFEESIYATLYRDELSNAYNKAIEEGKTEPIRKWKEANLIHREANDTEYILKEIESESKINAVAHIYTEYEKAMYERGLYDFDDMIIDLNLALKNNTDLLSNVAERYLYIMIDEFQDTSDAQMQIVNSIASHPINEGRPNVCVVGDDDQAIYKFQGAEINNIINFRHHLYNKVKVITLKNNYRSSQEIIDLSSQVADASSQRLTHKYSDIDKNMISHNSTPSTIESRAYGRRESQYSDIANEIQNILKSKDINDDYTIAIIARNNDSLRAMSKYLSKLNIEYSYAYKDNALTLPPITDIINILKYLASVHNNDEQIRDDLLPAILAAPYWNVDTIHIFEIAYTVKQKRVSWLEAIRDNVNTKHIYESLISLSVHISDMHIVDMIHLAGEACGIFNYYYKDIDTNNNSSTSVINNSNYYLYLEALRSLYEAIEEADRHKKWTALNIFEFLLTYEKYNIPLLINAPSNSNSKVHLLTAHKAKGLEFNRVYIIDLDDNIWTKKPRPNIAPIPKYLKQILSPIAEDENDSVRLLFVAITRAKSDLIMSYTNNINRHIPVYIIENFKSMSNIVDNSHDNILTNLLIHKNNVNSNEILTQMLENYQMSPTHFNNYLKVEEGGPAYYLKVNLLRFPQPLNSQGAYGTAIHDTVESIIKHGLSLNDALETFEKKIQLIRLKEVEKKKLKARGLSVIKNYYEYYHKHQYAGTVETEVNLAYENINYKGAHITGKLDLINIIQKDDYDEGTIDVIDWKTGKTLTSWDKGLSATDQIKARRYRYQLMFYRLLLTNSRQYSKYKIGKLGLQFVEDNNIFTLYYDHNEEEYERFCKLVVAVYEKIMKLEFASTTELMPAGDYDNLRLNDLIEYENKLLD